MKSFDHPIFSQSIQLIQEQLGSTGLDALQQQVLERLIHSSGDFALVDLLCFSPGACNIALDALLAGATVLTDTYMASAAVVSMARRTLKTPVNCVLDWTADKDFEGLTRTASGMKAAWSEISSKVSSEPLPIVLIGSAPTALNTLLDLVDKF